MVDVIMVELKTKVSVTTLCFCNGTIHPQHSTTPATTTTTLLHHHNGTIHPQHTTTPATTTTTLLHHHNHHHRRLLLHHNHPHQQHQRLSHHTHAPSPTPPPPPPPPPPPTPSPPQQQQQGKMPSASRIVRRYRKSRLKRVKRQEFKKLKDMVPALQEKPVVTKVEVIEEAIKYIDQLHSALIERFRTRGLPPSLRDLPLEPREVHGGNIRELVRRLLAASNPAALPPARLENARALPSFMHKLAKTRRL